MATANSMAELEAMIRQEMMKAMQVVQSKAEADMYEETGSFYRQGSPSIYRRTGNLGSSPRVSGLTGGGNLVSFDAYLDPGSYTVPNPDFTSRGFGSYFSPLQVLTAAENGGAHILGRSGFWRRSEEKIEKDLNETFASFFG